MERLVIFGGGFSSLCLGALLAKEGRHHISILEKGSRWGGYAQELDFAGYRFPMGPRYLWDFGRGEPALEFFEKLGLLGADDFLSLDTDAFDEVYIGNLLAMRVPMGWDRYQARLEQEFPTECAGIGCFFHTCRKIDRVFRKLLSANVDYRGYIAIPRAILAIGSPLESAIVMMTNARRTLADEFKRCGLSVRLQTILAAHLAIFCEVPREVSLVGYAVATLNYHRGSYYPKQNIELLIRKLIDFIKSKGGDVRLNETVLTINTKGNRISSIECAEKVYKGEIFISNIDPVATYRMIRQPDHKSDWTPSYARSNSLLSLFLGCEINNIATFPFGRGQKWIIESEETLGCPIFDKNRKFDKLFPEYLYINSPSAFSAEGEPCGPTQHSATVTAFVPGSFQFWRNLNRREFRFYLEQKSEAVQNVIQSIVWPDLIACKKVSKLLTPRDYEERLGALEGHIYGKRFRPRDLFIDHLSFRSKLENLFFCSAFTNQPGLASCVRGAQYLFEILTKKLKD